MRTIDADGMHFETLNDMIRREKDSEITIEKCLGQRYIASGLGGKKITIHGVPGNALGAYMDGSEVVVTGNAQDATGDTMNEGRIVIHGSAGDATGYAMRGGKIFVEGDVGYRAGIHMKAYQDKVPVIVIGGVTGSFLGEYQAGGIIIVLGNDKGGRAPVGNFCGTGMHGGKIFLRCDQLPERMPEQVIAGKADEEDMAGVEGYIKEFCGEFGWDAKKILSGQFYVLVPNTKNPYKQLYTQN